MVKKAKRFVKPQIIFPMRLLRPIGVFLAARLRALKRRRQTISKDDPFLDTARISDNASPDTDAEEQFGHARVMAVREQLDRNIMQTRRALARVKIGRYGVCEECGSMIDTDRLTIYPEATLCVKCERKKEKKRR